MSAPEMGVAPIDQGIRVLALDGGGIRGLSSLILLRELMQRIAVAKNALGPIRPCDYFDLIIGTGTGGLSALFVGRMHMTADEAIEAYLLMGKKGFKRPRTSKFRRLWSNKALFDGDPMTHVVGGIVEAYVGDRDAQLHEPSRSTGAGGRSYRTAVLATSSANASGPPHIFRSYRANWDPASTHAIHEVARATTATAGLFPPISLGFPPVKYIEAGVAGYNNPAAEALNEVDRIWPDADVTCLVSLGTGLQSIVKVDGTWESVMKVSRRLIEDCEKVHEQLRLRCQKDGLPYYRFNVTSGLDAAGILEWDEETDSVITAVTEGYTRKGGVDGDLNSCVSLLVGKPPAETRSPLRLLRTIRDEALAEKIFQWLDAPDSSRNYNTAYEKHQKGTGSWFIDGRDFSQWKEGRGSFLCIYGKPGCGKTVLCSSVISHVANVCNQGTLCAYAYFFFDGRDAQTKLQLHDGFIRSLIRQFTHQCNGTPEVLVKGYGDGFHQLPTRDLENILRHILEGFADAFIIVDSVDECVESNKFLNWINEMALLRAENLHVLVTTRPEEDIKRCLQFRGLVSISMEENVVNHDIMMYIDSKLQEGRLQDWPKTVQSRVENKLMEKAQGMFRWLAIQLDELQNCLDVVELDQQLERMPKDLDETYSRVLARISEQRRTRAKIFLQWTEFSARPLSLEELGEAAAVDFDQDNLPTYNPGRRYQPQDVLTACASLLIQADGYVKLAHFSVKEYLISDRIADGGAKYFGTNEKLSHVLMAETSLAYLLQLDSPGPLKDKTLAAAPLAEYVASQWVFHVRSGGGEGTHGIYKRITTLLESGTQFVNWISLWDPETSEIRMEIERSTTETTEPLYFAALLGFTRVARQLLQHGVKVNGPGSSGGRTLEGGSYMRYGNALQAACREDHMYMVELLVESGADVNMEGGVFNCSLQAATSTGNLANVQLLLNRGAKVNIQGGHYGSPLQAASARGHLEVVKLLLSNHADVNVRGDVASPLYAASAHGCLDIVRLLLANHADVNMQGGRYGSPLQAATENGHFKVVRLLLENRAEVNVRGGFYGSPLYAASAHGDLDVVKLLLANGAHVNLQGELYGNALQAASTHGDLEVVRLLLANHADVNAQGGFYGSPLYAASIRGHLEVVRRLLENRAEVNVQGGYRRPPLAAANKGHLEIVTRLLENHADVNMHGRYGSPLQAASEKGYLEIVRLLLANNADVNMQGGRYGSPLQAATENGHLEVVALLLENHADVNMQGGNYGSPLQAASEKGHLEIVRLLLESC